MHHIYAGYQMHNYIYKIIYTKNHFECKYASLAVCIHSFICTWAIYPVGCIYTCAYIHVYIYIYILRSEFILVLYKHMHICTLSSAYIHIHVCMDFY